MPIEASLNLPEFVDRIEKAVNTYEETCAKAREALMAELSHCHRALFGNLADREGPIERAAEGKPPAPWDEREPSRY